MKIPPVSKLARWFEPYGLTHAQRLFLLPYFGVQSVLDPTKGHAVAGFNDAINASPFTGALLRKLQASPEGRALLQAKPLYSSENLNVADLQGLPEGSMGRAYAKFMTSHAFSPDDRAKVRFTLDPELAYVSARYRQVHDFWHVLCGLPPTILGEVSLKAFEAAHTGLPSAIVSASIGSLSLSSSADRKAYVNTYLPWAWSAGRSCACLLSFDYLGAMGDDVPAVQRRLRITPAPSPPLAR